MITPAHQSVLGSVLSPARRRAFIDWACTGSGLLIEDDYDGEFRYGRQPVGALQAMAPENVAYLGSVSKTLGPALRLGWMVLPRRLVEPVSEAKYYADVQTEVIGQLVLAELIRTHAYDRHVRARRLRYRSRRDELLRRLACEAPEVRARGAAAGLHITLELPPGGAPAGELRAIAAAHGLALLDLGRSWHVADPARPVSVMVGYATPADHAYSAALDALCATLRAAVSGGKAS
ncbi:aminotransferase class I and II [Murinocardiopsis flavida]|uniref:Aminotransferase class I and II n=1 Tax=Murinocardiopsis flavida TaxID=645275 RepID=A0A2P8DLC4_9ACTN|nr:aminotransferase class I/II-fold pyridoxal phosphate-dependent enzyme [Murinocardiopsis flavida]PSK98009.1 aminotransferase class I and II [Murinocardiopsis flavida]